MYIIYLNHDYTTICDNDKIKIDTYNKNYAIKRFKKLCMSPRYNNIFDITGSELYKVGEKTNVKIAEHKKFEEVKILWI